MANKGDDSKKGHRQLHVKVRSARGRKPSSTKWLQRQLNDPFVQLAQKEGYRSRAVYKLSELDQKFNVVKPNSVVVDLGCSPGSWLEYLAKKVKNGRVIGIDLTEIEPVAGTEFIHGDFTEDETLQRLIETLGGVKPDVVLSDMAAPACGHTQTDHIRIMALCELAFDFAHHHLAKDGTFIAKILQGGAEKELLNSLKHDFSKVRHVKPEASRSDSAEMYVIATGFRGDKIVDDAAS